MTKIELIAFYEKRRQNFEGLLTRKKQQINLVSNVRLLIAAVTLIIIYFGFKDPVILYAGIPFLIGFIWLVRWHSDLFVEKVHLTNLVAVNVSEAEALQGDFSSFSQGSEFIDPHHPYTHDLDIFGEGSLYQSINRCNTRDGKKSLSHLLSTHLPSAEEIRLHQQAIKELASKADFRQNLQASGMEIDEQPRDRPELLSWIKVPDFIYGNPVIRIILWLLPLLTILSLIGWIMLDVPKGLFFLFVLAQWITLGIYSKRINAFHEYISRKKNILEKYGHILNVFQPETFASTRGSKLRAEAQNADVKVKKLASLVTALNARLNFMTSMFVNSILLYDMQCVYRLEKWKRENASSLQLWMDAICEAEVLSSLGTFAFNNPGFVYAVIHDELAIETQGVGHPLLSVDECVTNDIALGKEPSILVITGANMAGKSTFLRTMGVNLVLALAGAPVCAKSYRCPVVAIRSGMRTADSLKDHESYFYAELHRLKSIMDELRNGKPLFILLDEILKGTNSGDKQRGSIALVRQLVIQSCLALVATHDLALGDLEKEYPGRIRNFCFEANIENDQLSFDYRLKPGLAQKMNATFLMKKMGIIPD